MAKGIIETEMPKLNRKYLEQGFAISKASEKSWELSFKNKSVFLFANNVLIRNDFVDKLCQAFLDIHQK